MGKVSQPRSPVSIILWSWLFIFVFHCNRLALCSCQSSHVGFLYYAIHFSAVGGLWNLSRGFLVYTPPFLHWRYHIISFFRTYFAIVLLDFLTYALVLSFSIACNIDFLLNLKSTVIHCLTSGSSHSKNFIKIMFTFGCFILTSNAV